MARNTADGSAGHGLFQFSRIVAETMLLLASRATLGFAIAFSSEVESGSRQENASKHKDKDGVFRRFREAVKNFSAATASGQRRRAIAWLGMTFMLGLGFIATEISQLHGMAVADAGPWQSGYLSAFFTLVGTCGAHVSLGLVWIALLGGELAWRGPPPAATSRLYRLGLFWHFLVIVWISIFAFVYLPRLM